MKMGMKKILFMAFAALAFVACVEDKPYKGEDDSVEVDYSVLILNEVDGVNKVVELYNSGEEAVPLKDVYIVKNDETAALFWEGGNASGSIAAGGYVLIGEGEGAGFTASGGISAKKNVKFELFDPDDNSLDGFLRIDPGVIAIDADCSDAAPNSFQRIPNATGEWMMALPTNGAANAATGTAIPAN